MLTAALVPLAVALVLAGGLVFLYQKDKNRVRDLAAALGLDLRFTLWRGWVAESASPRVRLWITRWEDLAADAPALLFFLDYPAPLPFPLALVNKQSRLWGRPFARPFSSPGRLKEVKAPTLPPGLHLACRPEDQDRVLALVHKAAEELARFAQVCLASPDLYLFNLGGERFRLSLDLDADPAQVKRLFEAALRLLRALGALQSSQRPSD